MLIQSLINIAFLLLNPSFADQTNAFDVFEKEVHPQLVKRCYKCHGISQNPYHSVLEVGEAYKAAIKTISLNLPEESALWQRSFNYHCGKMNVCGYKDEGLKKAILSWIASEKSEKSQQDDGFTQLMAQQINLEEAINNMVEVNDGKGNIFSFKLEKLDATTLLIKEFSWKGLGEDVSLDGIQIRSPDISVKYQNLSNSMWVFKKTKERSRFINLINKKVPSLIATLASENLETLSIQIWIKNLRQFKAINELEDFYRQNNYNASIDQANYDTIQKIYAGTDGNCAIFTKGYVKCWSMNRFLTAQVDTAIGDEDSEMFSIRPYLNFSGEEGISSISYFSAYEGAPYNKPNMEVVITKNGKVFIRKYVEVNNTHQYGDFYQIPIADKVSSMIEIGHGLKSDPEFVCFKAESKKIYCMNAYHRDESIVETPQSLSETLFVIESNDEVIKSVHKAFNGLDSMYYVLFESGKLKVVPNFELRRFYKTKGSNLNEIPYFDIGSKARIEKIINWDRASGYWGSGTFFIFEDGSFKLFYDTTYEPYVGLSGVKYGGYGEDKDRRLRRLADVPFYRFTDAHIIDFAMATEQSCFVLDNGKVSCIGHTGIGTSLYDPKYLYENFPGSELQSAKGDITLSKFVNLGVNAKSSQVYGMGRDSFVVIFKDGRIKNFADNLFTKHETAIEAFIGDPESELGDSLPYVNLGSELKVNSLFEIYGGFCLLFNTTMAKCFGENDTGQLGLDDKEPHYEMGDERPFLKIQNACFTENTCKYGDL